MYEHPKEVQEKQKQTRTACSRNIVLYTPWKDAWETSGLKNYGDLRKKKVKHKLQLMYAHTYYTLYMLYIPYTHIHTYLYPYILFCVLKYFNVFIVIYMCVYSN